MYISWSCNYNTVNRESKLQQCMASLMSSLSYLGRDYPNSREEALSLGSNNAGAEQSLVLAIDDAELPLQLRPAS